MRLFREPRLRRRLLIAVLAGLLTLVPLIGTLGYENAFVLAPIFSLLGIGVGVDASHRARERLPTSLGRLCGRAAGELLVLHAIAVGLTLLGRLWQRGCDPLGGALFYLMGPVISSVLGTVCGLWAGVVARSRVRAVLLGFVPMGACLAVGLWRLWGEPVVYAFDPFWGYFSGSVYDEAVAVGERYLKFRGYNMLGLAAALLAFALFVDPKRLRMRRSYDAIITARPVANTVALFAGLVVAAGSCAVLGVRGAHYGFTANLESITERLAGEYETEHFVIHYAPRSAEARSIELVAAEHEFAWARLEKIMGRAPSQKVHSFLFRNRDQKRALMGAGTVQVAAPWRYQIYLDHRSFPHPVLHHELAHVFGSTIGDDLFGVSRSGLHLNIGLIEGFATAVAPRPADRLDLHDQVKVLGALKRRPPLAAIMGPGFFSKSSRVAYTTAGSFCAWLIDNYEFEKMATLYRTAGDFEEAYGESLTDLEQRWLAFLEERPGVTQDDIDAQAQRFKRRSVFQRPCAHKVADVRREIGRAANRGRWNEVVEGWESLCSLEPQQPAHKLGRVVGLAEARRFDEAREVLDEVAAMPDLTVTMQGAVFSNTGDVALFLGDRERARAAYDEALALPTSAGARRVLALKRFGTTDPRLAEVLTKYFGLFDIDGDGVVGAVNRMHGAIQIREWPEHRALGSYLLARQLLNTQQGAAAHPYLEEALAPEAKLPNADFTRAARLALVNASLQTRDYDRASQVLTLLEAEEELGNGERLVHEYWRDRIAFFETYRP